MISGLNSTGHEIGGTIGIAIFSTIAAGASGAHRRPAGSLRDRARVRSQPGSSLASPAWSHSPFSRAREHFLAEAAAQPAARCPSTDDGEDDDTGQASAPKRRRADAERSVAAILDAALEALASDPDVSMAEIARRAGRRPGDDLRALPDPRGAARRRHGARDRAGRRRDRAKPSPTRGEPKEALERVLLATWQATQPVPRACSRSTSTGSRRRSCTADTSR